jgi:P4 family phage/plasmid primase-like protien
MTNIDKMTAFNTIQYCIDNSIPCFTFFMDDTKCLGKNDGWKHITPQNFTEHINPKHNGVALLTGYKHFMIDVDCKHNVPVHIIDTLKIHSKAYEKTPGGFHFYFLIDERTKYIRSSCDRYWNGNKIQGLDIRGNRGISYISPCAYLDIYGNTKSYKWEYGNLSTADYITDELFEAINHPDNFSNSDPMLTLEEYDTHNEPLSDDKWEEVVKLVDMLSVERATEYDTWRDVIFSLKNTEASDRMLELCHAFSKKASNYDARSVNKKFYGGRPKSRPLTIKSLYYWAKQDSPEDYQRMILMRNYNEDEYLYDKLIDGQISLANMYYSLHGNDFLIIYDNDRMTKPNFYMFNYSSTLWDIVSKDIIGSDISEKLSIIVKNLLLKFTEKSCSMDKNSNDIEIKRKQDEINNKIKELRKLHLSIQDIKKGISIAGHVIKCKQKEQYESIKMNKNPKLLSVRNGMIDLQTGELIERIPEHYQTFYIPIDYNPNADTSLMDKFIDNMFKSSEKDVQKLLCNLLGYSISGVADKKVISVIVGDGENGKSELINIIKEVLGKKMIGTVEYEDLSVSSGTNTDTLFNARFARMMIIIETKPNAQFNENKLKKISGRDTQNVQAKFKGSEEMSDECIPFIISNFKPKFSGDQTVWNRVIPIALNMQFIDRSDVRWDEDAYEEGNMKPKDGKFIKELYKDKEGVLRWLVKQSEIYFKEGFIIPETTRKLKEDYQNKSTKNDNNEIKRYIENNWIIDNSGEIEIDTVIEQYRNDFPNDILLSNKQIESKIVVGLKEIGAEKRKKDIKYQGERVQTWIWKIKKL